MANVKAPVVNPIAFINLYSDAIIVEPGINIGINMIHLNMFLYLNSNWLMAKAEVIEKNIVNDAEKNIINIVNNIAATKPSIELG